MNLFRAGGLPLTCLGFLAAIPAHAQWAVVDAPAIVQLVQEVRTLEQVVQGTRDQLAQTKLALRTMTGNRGMQALLGGVSRNYLPSSWAQLTSVMQGGAAGYPGLAADVRTAMANNAVLTPRQLAALTPTDQQQVVAGRQSSALRQALAQQALANASGRFAAIQTLVAAIGTASDQKSILDLQARISAELAMLQNEQTKLEILHQATLAQGSVNEQREREEIIAAQGRFSERFRPAPNASMALR